MKQIIKRFLQKYTHPIWDGQSLDELAEMLEKELNRKPKLNCKLGEIDDSLTKAMGFKTNPVEDIQKIIDSVGFKTRPLKKVAQVDIYDRNWEAVDDEFANLVKK